MSTPDTLDAPCAFCGYNGPGYWQVGTHQSECPWHSIGGGKERWARLRDVLGHLMGDLIAAERTAEDLQSEVWNFVERQD